ncbi:MAG: excisionase family DNA-binding protein [Planctomycetota bacterium]|jgi:excisionase family DNA binding protein
MDRLLTTGQVAKLCSVTPDTVLRWIKKGRIRAERTPGGHHRLHRSDVESLRAPPGDKGYEFCWEFHSEEGRLQDACRECLVYQARALRCYELAVRAPEQGHAKLFCKTTCEECDYYQAMLGRAANVLVVSNREEVTRALEQQAFEATFNLAVTDCEYSLSALVASFRPDFVVLDCGMGKDRTRDIARHLLEDSRARLVRIILAGDPGEYPGECDREFFAHIERPFRLEQIGECIRGIRGEIRAHRGDRMA